MLTPTLSSFQGVVQDSQGNAIPGATVIVLAGQIDTVTTTTQPGSPLATIYADPYGYSEVPQVALNLSGDVTTAAGSPNVSYSSGNRLSSYLAGQTITINGVQYTVSSVNPSAGTLVLATNALSTGTFSWSATIPVTPLETDGGGNYQFWCAAGYYVLQIYGAAITVQFLLGISIYQSVTTSGTLADGGFGNGAAGQQITTTLKGTGTGPVNPANVVRYAEFVDPGNGQTYYLPMMQ